MDRRRKEPTQPRASVNPAASLSVRETEAGEQLGFELGILAGVPAVCPWPSLPCV